MPICCNDSTGTETRVNAHEQANQFIIDYIESSKQVLPFLLLHPDGRLAGSRTPLAGTTVIPVTDAGSLASMFLHKGSISLVKILFLPLWHAVVTPLVSLTDRPHANGSGEQG